MAKDIKRHFSNLKSSGDTAPAAADLVYGEIAVGYKKGAEALYIKNHSGNVVTFSSDNIISGKHNHDDRYYTESELTGSSTSVVVAKAASAITAASVDVISTNPSSSKTYYPTWVSGSGNGAKLNVNNGLKYVTVEGTTTESGGALLYLGNATSAGTAGNKEGQLRIYSSTEKYAKFTPSELTANRTYTFPNKTGTVALTSDITSYSAGAGLRLTGTTFVSNVPRVAKDSKGFGGQHTWIMEEYTAGSNYNLPSNAWYHIMSSQGGDSAYGTQLALGMTTAAAYYREYNNSSWGAWKSILYDSTKLPLTGGTLTGALTINPAQASSYQDGIILNDKGSGAAEALTIKWTSASYTTGVKLAADLNGNQLIMHNGTSWYTILNTGNSSHTHSTVVGSYTGNGGQQKPNYFGTNKVGFLMMNTTVNSNSNYKDWIIMDCYSNNDVGGGVAFGVNRQALGAYIMRSASGRTSWAESAELIGTHNYTTYCATANHTHSNYSLTSHTHSDYSLTSHTHSYLPLTGGTMTGSIIPNTDNAIDLGSSTKRWNHIYSYGIWGKSGAELRLGGNDATLMYLTANNRCGIGTDSPGAKLGVAGGDNMWAGYFSGYGQSGVYLAYGGGQGAYICSKKNDSTYLFALYKNQTSLGSGGDIVMYARCDGKVGINTSSPSYDLHVAGNIYATGGVIALSDARHKTVVEDIKITVEDIAKMPSVRFKWNDGRNDDTLHVGTLAQNWQSILPEVVSKANDEEGTLSVQYGVAALVSSITTARKVVDHENEIKALKAKINVLEERISELEK